MSAITDTSSIQVSRLSLIAGAKRDAAKRNLYSRFFRGPTLGPEVILKQEQGLSTFGNIENPVVDNTEAHITASQSTTTNLKSFRVSKQKRKSGGKNDDADTKRAKKKRRKEGGESDRVACKTNRTTGDLSGDTTSPSQGPTIHEDNRSHRKIRNEGKKKRGKAVKNEVAPCESDEELADGAIQLERKKKKKRKIQQS